MSLSPLVRLVDDDLDLLDAQLQALRIAGFATEGFSSAEEALKGLGAEYPGVVLSDVRMPGMDGFAFFRAIRDLDPDLPVILLTGHGDVPMAVSAMREGVWDFLTKPVRSEDLTAALRRALQARALVLENRALKAGSESPAQKSPLIGESPVMEHLRTTAARLAEAKIDALLCGPSGAGKEAVAREIHRLSKGRSFVHVACDALDEARFDADFFGAEAGHPAAPRHARLTGRIEKAHRGTLFLDRLHMLTPALQTRLLHLIETREYWSLGASAPRSVEMTVLGSTKVDLEEMVQKGEFRADLYYRLSGVKVSVPPLFAHKEDVPQLFKHFLREACARLDLALPDLTPAVQAKLSSHDWPGNVRELLHYAESFALRLTAAPLSSDTQAASLADLMAAYEESLLRDALRQTGGSVTRAMERLSLPRKTFYDKLNRHGIRPEEFRAQK